MKKIVLFLIFFLISVSVISQCILGFDLNIRNVNSLVISEIFKGSIAEKYDFKKGDIILQVDSTKFFSPYEINEYFHKNRKNQYIIKLLRNKRILNKKIKLPDYKKVYLGVFLLKTPHGILIDDVLKNSPAYNAKLKKGDIILKIEDKVIKFPEDVSKKINEVGYGKTITIYIRNSNRLENKRVKLYYWDIPAIYRGIENNDLLHDLKQIIYMLEKTQSYNYLKYKE